MEEKVRWSRCLRFSSFTPVRRRKSEVKAACADLSLDKQMLQDVLKKKVLSPSQLRIAAMDLINEYKVSVQKATAAVMLHRSAWYYNPKAKNDELLCMRMREIAHIRIRYGFWRIFILLRREGFKDNHKRVYRLYKAEGLNLRSKRSRRNRSGMHREGYPAVNDINQCWSMDFVSDTLYNKQKFRTLTIIDNFSRKCVAIEEALEMSA